MSFGLFDPNADYRVVWRHLPHWEQPGATYFITWRTRDSMPKAVIESWNAERVDWLQSHGLLTPGSAYQRTSELGREALEPRIPQQLIAEYRAFVANRWDSQLDKCHGPCVLKRPELARIVAGSLLHFDGKRYSMASFVVMPNHLHLLVSFPAVDQLLSQCRSWKKYTAGQINKRLGCRGEFWQDESFDHLVRSTEEFESLWRYIAENPVRAHLPKGSYLLYQMAEIGSAIASRGAVAP